MVEDVKSYCDANHLDFFSILGHSMGGKTAMLFACNYPKMVKNLLIADIAPKHYPQHHQSILQGLNAVHFDIAKSRNDVESVLEQYIPEMGTRQFLMKNLYWVNPNQLGFRFNLKALTQNIEKIGEALSTEKLFNGNTLFLRGELSLYILNDDVQNIYHHFPKSTLKTIPKAGHWLHAENPSAFLQETIPFLKS
jgi:esterase